MGIIRSGEPEDRADKQVGVGAGVKVCPQCGTEYLGWAIRCASCGVALVEPEVSSHEQLLRGDITVLDLDDEDQVVYELGVYTLAQRTELAEMLANDEIPHAWEGEDLVVHVVDEQAVDALCARVEGTDVDVDPTEVAARTEALADPGTDAVTYDLDEWEDDERERLGSLLLARGVAHVWDGTTLLVHADDEARADGVMDEIEYPDAIDVDAAAAQEGEGGGELLSELFIVADVLRRDPTDTDAWERLGTVLDASHPDEAPFGVDPAVWRDVMNRGEALEELLDSDVLDDDAVVEHAGELRARLRPLV